MSSLYTFLLKKCKIYKFKKSYDVFYSLCYYYLYDNQIINIVVKIV